MPNTRIDAKDLMRLHVQALFTCDGAGRLVAVNEPGGAAAPRFFFGQTSGDNAWWFRHDIDPRLAIELDGKAVGKLDPQGRYSDRHPFIGGH